MNGPVSFADLPKSRQIRALQAWSEGARQVTARQYNPDGRVKVGGRAGYPTTRNRNTGATSGTRHRAYPRRLEAVSWVPVRGAR